MGKGPYGLCAGRSVHRRHRRQVGAAALAALDALAVGLDGVAVVWPVGGGEWGVNTVGTHMRSVFTKLNIQSRVQLANVLHETAS